jgi:hypothetical protein
LSTFSQRSTLVRLVLGGSSFSSNEIVLFMAHHLSFLRVKKFFFSKVPYPFGHLNEIHGEETHDMCGSSDFLIRISQFALRVSALSGEFPIPAHSPAAVNDGTRMRLGLSPRARLSVIRSAPSGITSYLNLGGNIYCFSPNAIKFLLIFNKRSLSLGRIGPGIVSNRQEIDSHSVSSRGEIFLLQGSLHRWDDPPKNSFLLTGS